MSATGTIAGGRLTVDLDAIVANYRSLAARVAPADMAAVVKADAYGLGAARVAPLLESAGCSRFFVASLGEALALLPSLSADSAVYVLNGLQPGEEAACADAGAVPVLNGLEQVWRWRDLAVQRAAALPAVIQIDSGMARLGLSAPEVARLASDEQFFRRVPLLMVMSHLACADEPVRESNNEQRARFNALADLLPPAPRSLANSGGAFLGADFHGDVVRSGVSLYGGAPNDGPSAMRPVVGLVARVIQVRDVAAEDGVGYGLTYARPTPGVIATVAVGYADGWPRHLSNTGAAYYRGVRLPIAGRVSMDSITLDVSALAECGLELGLGDEVELLGPNQTIDDVARDAGTIAYEILTSLGGRYDRTYLQGRAGEAAPVQATATAA